MKDFLQQITERISEMPRVSDTPYKLLRATANEKYQINDVVSIVESDVSLTSQCLQMVNSAAFGISKQISSIQRAVILLGSSTITKIAMGLAFKNVFTSPMDGYGADKYDFWEHSMRTALAARIIAKELKLSVPEDLAYTAGLLHDIGKAIISEYLGKYEGNISAKFDEIPGEDFLAIETDILGTDHTLVGEAMAKKWQFPEALIQVIRYHHHPCLEKGMECDLVATIHIADIMAMLGGKGTGVDTLAYSIDPNISKKYNMDRNFILKLMFEVDMDFINTKNKYNIFAGD